MMRVRPEEDKNAYRCCFCCHVTTGTILLGLWHLVVQMTVVIMFVVMVMHPELELPSAATGGAFVLAPRKMEEQKIRVTTQNPVAEETKHIMFDSIMSLYLDNNNGREKAGKEEANAYNDWGKKLKGHNKPTTAEDKAVGVAVAASSLAITIMLIYGTARGRPGYIMPFFCLQAFDFCISCLTVVGYLSYMPDIKKWIKSQPDLPYKDDLLAMSPQTLDLLAISFFFAIVLVKAYFLGVVWATYKYLVNRMAPQMAVRESLSSLYFPMLSPIAERRGDFSDEVDSEDQAEHPGAPLLPPKYEDAIKAPKDDSIVSIPPPPPYTPFAPGLF